MNAQHRNEIACTAHAAWPCSLAPSWRGVCSPYGAPAMPVLFLASNTGIGMDRYKNKAWSCQDVCCPHHGSLLLVVQPALCHAPFRQSLPVPPNAGPTLGSSSFPCSTDLFLTMLLSLLLFWQARVPGSAYALNLMLLIQLERNHIYSLGSEVGLCFLKCHLEPGHGSWGFGLFQPCHVQLSVLLMLLALQPLLCKCLWTFSWVSVPTAGCRHRSSPNFQQ